MKPIKAGGIAYMVGIFGSLAIGLATAFVPVFIQPGWLTWFLIVAGLVIGFMNITSAESTGFMVACLTLAVGVGALAIIPFVGTAVNNMFTTMTSVLAPAALVVAATTIKNYAK